MFSLVACNNGGGTTTNNKKEEVKTKYGSIELIKGYEDTMTGVFDEKNIVLTFSALSDLHMGGNKHQ